MATKRDPDLDSLVVRAHRRGLAPETVGQAFSLSPDEVAEILDRAGDDASPVDAHLAKLDEAISELAVMASSETGVARVAAIKARTGLMKDRLDVSRELGLTPTTTSNALTAADLNRAARGEGDAGLIEALVTALDAEGVAEDVALRVVDRLAPLVGTA